MVGLSHIALRSVIQDYMPAGAVTWWPTEMLNSRRLPTQVMGETPHTLKGPGDSVLVPQILGNQERHIAASVKKLEEFGVKGIDINMGCPVRKALKHNYGVALMGDSSYAAEVVAMTVRHTSLPVSVKLRAAEEGEEKAFIQFVTKLEQAGASALCLHPRTSKQKRRGSADWEQIKHLKDYVSIPVIGNGDVQTYEDALRMKEETGCDAVMIGRALTGRPWLLWQIGHELGLPAPIKFQGRKPPQTKEEEAYEYGRALSAFIRYCFSFFIPPEARKRVLFYSRVSHMWLNFGHRLDALLRQCHEEEHMLEVVQAFFDKPGLAYSARTELRY